MTEGTALVDGDRVTEFIGCCCFFSILTDASKGMMLDIDDFLAECADSCGGC